MSTFAFRLLRCHLQEDFKIGGHGGQTSLSPPKKAAKAGAKPSTAGWSPQQSTKVYKDPQKARLKHKTKPNSGGNGKDKSGRIKGKIRG